MEKFDYLLTRMKSYRDHQGSLLDHSVVLYGSGMGHSDNHTATRIPIILAGQGGGLLKTGRYVRYAENQQLGRLHLALLKMFDAAQDSFAYSTSPLSGLNGSDFTPYSEQPFESWVKQGDGTITVQGRLRLSDNLDEARIFLIDVQGQPSVRIDVAFRDFHDFNLAYHCGTAVKITGTVTEKNGQSVITKVQKLDSLFGKKPGTANG
jgi:hypothetical protein